jgi:hypothetical protein
VTRAADRPYTASVVRSLLVLLLLLALLGLAVVLWPEPPATPSRPTNGPDLASATMTGGTAPEVAAGEQRAAVAHGTGSIAGTLVDAERHPLAEGRVRLVVADVAVEPGVLTDAAGRFTLFGVPPGPVAIRAEAARRVTIQLGDLFPDLAFGMHLELGELRLGFAVTWQGTVRSRGHGVAAATVSLLPQLGAPGTPTPLVQRTSTEADGAFVFVSGIGPPCTVRVDADGFESQFREVASANERLDIELVPLPRVRGRVVAEDGSPLPQARVFVQTGRGATPPGNAQAHPDPHPSLTHPVDANAAFDLPAPAGVVVQAMADDHVATVLGPFSTATDVGPLTLVLARGCTVRGQVTWRGDPIAAMALLWNVPAAAAPLHVASVGGDGALRLPPVPPGRYRLVVAAEQGAFLERTLDLALDNGAPLELSLPEGARMIGSVRGERPDSAAVLCTHESGLRRRGLVRADGTFVVEGLGPGRWRSDVVATHEDFRSTVAMQMTALLDGPWHTVGAEAELRRDVDSAALRLGHIRGALAPEFAGARLELVPGDDAQRRIPVGLREVAVGDDGTFALEPVLPGMWRARLQPRSGVALERTVEVTAGAATVVTFP